MATLLHSGRITYYVASGTSSPDSSGSQDLRGKMVTYLESQDPATNSSYIRIDHYSDHYARTAGDKYVGLQSLSVRCNVGSYGGTYQTKSLGVKTYSMTAGSSVSRFLGSTYHTVYHNADGTGVLYAQGTYEAKPFGFTFNSQSMAYSNVTLPSIPRYATINSFTFNKASGAAGLSTLTCGWSVNATCDAVQYSLNGGGWTSSGTSGTSGSFNVGGLTPNVQYSLKIRVKRTDSQLWTESGTLYATTYDYGKVTGADNINDTGTPYMTFTNPSGAVINARLEGGSQNIQRNNISNVGSYSFTLTSEEINMLRATIPNASSMTLRYVIATVVDGVETYWAWLDRTFTVINADPIFTTWTYADTNAATLALTGNSQKIIKGYSNVKATITSANKMVAIKGATATSYQLTIGEKKATANYSPSSTVEMTINAVDNSVMTCYAKDSRENSTPKAITASTYINYTPISISAATGKRTDDIGTQTTLTYNGTFFNASFGSVTNTIKSAVYKYKKTTDVEYIDGTSVITPTPNGNKFSFSGLIKGDAGTGGVEGFDALYSYNIRVIVTDELSTHTFNFILGTGTPNIAIHQNGVAINQAYDETLGGALQVNGKVESIGENYVYTFQGSLPSGDGTNAYWQSLKPGIYWVGGLVTISGGSGKPTTYAMVSIMKSGSEVTVMWHQHAAGPVYKMSMNGSTVLTTASWGATYGAVTLYNDVAGTNGTVTLSETSANFTYIEVFYRNSDSLYSSLKVYQPNGKKITMRGALTASGIITYIKEKNCLISGTSITPQDYVEYAISASGISNYNGANNLIYITRVIGYR